MPHHVEVAFGVLFAITAVYFVWLFWIVWRTHVILRRLPLWEGHG